MITRNTAVNQTPLEKDTLVAQLSNYNLPHFVLESVAKKCDSTLVKKGKIGTILSSMNESALALLHKIFVQCEEDEEGEFADYRFAVFLSSRLHSSLVFDQPVTGKSGTVYKVKVAVFGEQGLVAVGENKAKGERVSIDELTRFNKMVRDIAKSKDGQNMLYAFFSSSVGYADGFNKIFARNSKTKTPPNKYGFCVAKTITLLEFRDKNTVQVFIAPF